MGWNMAERYRRKYSLPIVKGKTGKAAELDVNRMVRYRKAGLKVHEIAKLMGCGIGTAYKMFAHANDH